VNRHSWPPGYDRGVHRRILAAAALTLAAAAPSTTAAAPSTTAAALSATAAALSATGAVPNAAATPIRALPPAHAQTTAARDPLCMANYARPALPKTAPLRFGIDPGLAGSAGTTQIPTVPDNPVKARAAVRRLRPKGRVLVVRLNRLFWSDGNKGIVRFKGMASAYTRQGDEVEIQIRYHPKPADNGNIAAWTRYVRHVVDVLGANPRVVAMTVTNEVNITFSPNTSDGGYKRAQDALIDGIEAARAEARKRHYVQLQFGFTYAYRIVPATDAALFNYIGAHGGPRFRRALGFIGLDFYPGTVYPPVMLPGDTYRHELAQAAGVLRNCYAPMGKIGPRTPIWITENGISTSKLTPEQQASALAQLVKAAHAYSRTFGITDYRWFNLRDSVSSGSQMLSGLAFAFDGLLRANYVPKPSFGVYRGLIGALGKRSAVARAVR